MRQSRHILLRWHYLFDLVDEGLIEIKFIAGVDNPADFYTKAHTNTQVRRWSEWVQGMSWDEIARIRNEDNESNDNSDHGVIAELERSVVDRWPRRRKITTSVESKK